MDFELANALGRIVELKDRSTGAHTWRVTMYAQAMAEAASAGGAAAGTGARVRELELSLAAMRDAAKRDAELVKRAKGLEARAAAHTAAEERANAAEAKASRAEAPPKCARARRQETGSFRGIEYATNSLRRLSRKFNVSCRTCV